MLNQILAITRAQFRTIRNHLPRTSLGAVLMAALSLLWYGGFAAIAATIATWLPVVPFELVRQWFGVVLFGVFLFWQFVPLFTLTGGWSLQLDKLQVYPIANGTLFGIEVLLRLTTGLEMLLIVIGGCIGLLQHPEIPAAAALLLLLYVPFNLFVSLSVREVLLHTLGRNRFRELFAVLVIGISIFPQLLFRTGLGGTIKPYFLWIANGRGTPWRELALLCAGSRSPLSFIAVTAWIGLAFVLARAQFIRGLRYEEASTVRKDAPEPLSTTKIAGNISSLLSRLFTDPIAALTEKEIRSLVRMPRFRFVFGLACVFSLVVAIPMVRGNDSVQFVHDHLLISVNLYGYLVLSDSLLWNIFGFDRTAAQTYFVTPIRLKDVIRAKNLAAVLFMAIQTSITLLLVLLLRFPITWIGVLDAVSASAVAGLFLLCAGNLSSVMAARAIDPTQAMRKQAGAQIQIWILGCAAGLAVLIGVPFLARWSLQNEWAFLGTLGLEFAIGIVVYGISLESAVERGLRDRERILDALGKNISPMAS